MTGVINTAAPNGGLVKCCAILLAVLAAHFLISCGTSDEPTTTRAAVESEPQAPTLVAAEIPEVTATGETGAATGAPSTDPSVVRVGVVESVDRNRVAVATLDGTISVTLSDESTIQEFAAGSLENLLIGQRVTVMGQSTEAGLAARSVIVTLENTSLFLDQGDFQVGRSMRAIVGTIETISESSITVATKLGPRTATISAGETAFQLPTAASMDGLSLGQLVTVIGSEGADGSIVAQSVLITPDLGDLMAAGRRGGGRGGPQGQGPASEGGSAATPGPTPAFDAERQAGSYEGVTFLVSETSEARFLVREQLALLPTSHPVEMRTTALEGEIHLDGRPSVVNIDLHQLRSDQRLRDRYVRGSMFPDHPKAVFTLQDLGILPGGSADGEEVEAQITGVLNIRGADYPLRFDVTVQDKGELISIEGRTKFAWDDLGLDRPTAVIVLTLSDDVDVQVSLTARPLR
jgi:polyisoprenoid-binding protein YceI